MYPVYVKNIKDVFGFLTMLPTDKKTRAILLIFYGFVLYKYKEFKESVNKYKEFKESVKDR